MIHYHGTPINPERVAHAALRGRHAFVSFDDPRQASLAASVCQSFALDNGAFSAWKRGEPVTDWTPYYEWADEWLRHPACDFAVIPDVIGGTEDENDALVDEWPFEWWGAPVWHLNESVERLERLARDWPLVCLGSAAEYDVSNPPAALNRLAGVLPAISDPQGRPRCRLHGLRMLNPDVFSRLPLSSADSTNVARNHGYDKAWSGPYQPATQETRAIVLAERIEYHQAAATVAWDHQPEFVFATQGNNP